MPVLKQIECHLELTNAAKECLQEYATSYEDGVVNTFVAVPKNPCGFCIKLSSQGFIAEGLGAFVFIDGDYQCNRVRKGLRPWGKGVKPEETEVSFTLRQKERINPRSLGSEAEFIVRDWKFNKINTGTIYASNANSHTVDAIGTIVVLVLRCCEMERPSKMPTSQNMDPNSVGRQSRVSFKATPKSSTRANTKKETPAEPSVEDREESVVGFGGLFDGPADRPRMRPSWSYQSDASYHRDYEWMGPEQRFSNGRGYRPGGATPFVPYRSGYRDFQPKNTQASDDEWFQQRPYPFDCHNRLDRQFRDENPEFHNSDWTEHGTHSDSHVERSNINPTGRKGFESHHQSRPYYRDHTDHSNGVAYRQLLKNVGVREPHPPVSELSFGYVRDRHEEDRLQMLDWEKEWTNANKKERRRTTRRKTEKRGEYGKHHHHHIKSNNSSNTWRDLSSIYDRDHESRNSTEGDSKHESGRRHIKHHADHRTCHKPNTIGLQSYADTACGNKFDSLRSCRSHEWIPREVGSASRGAKRKSSDHDLKNIVADSNQKAKTNSCTCTKNRHASGESRQEEDNSWNKQSGSDAWKDSNESNKWDSSENGADNREPNREGNQVWEPQDRTENQWGENEDAQNGNVWGNNANVEDFQPEDDNGVQGNENGFKEQQNDWNNSGGDFPQQQSANWNANEPDQNWQTNYDDGHTAELLAGGDTPNHDNAFQFGRESRSGRRRNERLRQPYLGYPTLPRDYFRNAPLHISEEKRNPENGFHHLDKSETPLLILPEEVITSKGLEYQVRGGPESEYHHRTCRQSPNYIDTIEQPYATFIFHYRGKQALEKILEVPLKESDEEYKHRMANLSKEEILEELLKLKTQHFARSDNNSAICSNTSLSNEEEKSPHTTKNDQFNQDNSDWNVEKKKEPEGLNPHWEKDVTQGDWN